VSLPSAGLVDKVSCSVRLRTGRAVPLACRASCSVVRCLKRHANLPPWGGQRVLPLWQARKVPLAPRRCTRRYRSPSKYMLGPGIELPVEVCFPMRIVHAVSGCAELEKSLWYEFGVHGYPAYVLAKPKAKLVVCRSVQRRSEHSPSRHHTESYLSVCP